MKKEIREVDEKRKIVQVTTADERWYLKQIMDGITGIPTYLGVPSITWIAGKYPKGIEFYKWLAEKGWDEAEAIKKAAGEKGSKVHLAISAILAGQEVRIDSKFLNKSTGNEEELTLEECDCILAFIEWKKDFEEEYIIESISNELTVFSELHNCAGTVDWIVKITHKISGEVKYFIIDFKTSQYIWKEYELQVSAYKQLIENGENPILHNNKLVDVSNLQIAILQLGLKRNKYKKYKFTILEDKFELFKTAQKIWFEEHGGEQITQKDYPIVLSPGIKPEAIDFPDAVEVSTPVETELIDENVTLEDVLNAPPVKPIKSKKK